jgi:uncharacterized membrane protein YjgN (DUF898 family)
MEQPLGIDQPLPAGSIRPPEQLRFTGTGSGYFGIWIVNLLLTVVTLGIYAAWAKVRRLQYFYRHTELAGSSFDFHGSAQRILVGRILALVLLGLYQYCVRLQSIWTLVILGALAVIMPWLLRNSFRFRLYNASWRGTRFHFRGGVGGAYQVFLIYGFLSLVTGYLFAPAMYQKLKAYQHGNSWLGQTRCSFHARVSQFYWVNLLIVVGIMVFFLALFMTGAAGTLMAAFHTRQHVAPGPLIWAITVVYGSIIGLLFTIGPVYQALMFNLIWNNTRLGEHRIESKLSPWKLAWITLSNLVMIVVTLGLFIPWATVRLTRLKVESMRLIPATDLQEFVAAEPEALGAVGEEAAAVFDFDIAL